MSESFETSKDVIWLRELYFSDPSKQLTLQPGEKLLQEGTYNDKLFLILDGSITGYLEDENGENFEVFRSKPNMFLGVYSFFSQEHITYLTIIANEITTVAYLDSDSRINSGEKFASHFLPVMVHELYLRQLLAQRLTWQRQAAYRKLYENEKMALLGQLASGLAHELNNSIGVLQRNTEWLVQAMGDYLKSKHLNSLFENSVQDGMSFNTSIVRERRKSLEKKFNIPLRLAKQLAKSNLTEDQIKRLLKEDRKILEYINLVTEAGFVLHDMRVAADHSTHVVQSVRELGSGNRDATGPTSIIKTINHALALLKNILQNIQVDVDKKVDGVVDVGSGDLVQVWLNLIKNACESLTSSGTSNARISILIATDRNANSVTITDNGPGIPQELQSKIFEPNFTTKIKGLSFGLGLGLSIVKRIVSNHKGTISLTSRPGETSFIVQFPAEAHSEKSETKSK